MMTTDVAAAAQVWQGAYSAMRESYHLPVEKRTPETDARLVARVRHLLDTDPLGSWVAADGDRIVGLAQALIREDLWVLSLLGVDPGRQDGGVGHRLVDAALGYGDRAGSGLILCSRDPRAARRYVRAGFSLHPAVAAAGRLDRRRLPRSVPSLREGGVDDAAFVADLDRRLRGGAHGADLDWSIAQGCRLLILDGGGYAVARGAHPVFLAAVDHNAAVELLLGVVSAAGPDESIDVNWMTAEQQWAISTVVALGLELHPVGHVMTRGMASAPALYLPSGAFG